MIRMTNWKKRLFSLLLAAVWLAVSLPLTACQPKAERFSEHSFDYFDTVTTITGYAESRAEFDRMAAEILSELGEYHRLFTIYNRYDGMENLCTVNEVVDGVHRTVKVEGRIMDLLLYAKEMYEKTDGRMNIAMGSVLSIWHDYRETGLDDPANAKLPPTEALQKAAEHTDINNMILDVENSTVLLADPLMTLDVGAVAKGYTVEMVARRLEEQGIDGYVLNVGGNVRTVGEKADGSPWTAGITNPQESEAEQSSYVAYLDLTGESLVTSGSYQRYYSVDGKNYHHIIDPSTLMPAEGYLSVSVVCDSSADGDVLSTALFCMSAEEGRELLRSMNGAEALWILPDGTQLASDGFHKYLSDAHP